MSKKNKPTFHCKNEAQKNAIRRSYAQRKSKRVEAPYPHFRYYKSSNHPALIVGEQPDNEYRYRKVMHGEKEGHRNNETIYPNPNPNDPKPMRIAKRVRHDKKYKFEDKPLTWIYPKKK